MINLIIPVISHSLPICWFSMMEMKLTLSRTAVLYPAKREQFDLVVFHLLLSFVQPFPIFYKNINRVAKKKRLQFSRFCRDFSEFREFLGFFVLISSCNKPVKDSNSRMITLQTYCTARQRQTLTRCAWWVTTCNFSVIF